MSLINIINESFDKQNKKILAGAKSKKLKEAVGKYNNLDAIVISTDLADEVFRELRRKHIKPLAFYANDSDLFIFVDTAKKLNSACTLKEDNYEGISMDYGFEDDIDQLEALENTDEWINKLKEWCYLKPWQGVVYNYDGDISYNLETLLRESVKSKKLKEAVEKVYKYIVVNHFSPEDFYLIKSNHPVDENIFDSWNFLDVTDKHGKGTVIWNDENIIFNEVGNKSIAELDDEYRKGVVRYLSDLEKNGNLDTIRDEYISFDELEYEGYLTDFPAWLDPGDGDGVIEEYMNDKTLKNSYLATMYSDYLENSYVDKDSSSAAAYVDIDDLTQYTDYEEFFGEYDEDDDLDENIFIKKQKRKSQKLKETTNRSLHEYFDYGEAKDFDELGDMLDQSGDLIREAAEKLGFKDFEWEDSVQGPYGRSDFWITSDEGTRLHAMVDFSETWVTDLDEAIDLLNSLDWEDTSDNSDIDDLDDSEESYPLSLKQSSIYLLDAARELGLKDFDYDYNPSSRDITLRYIDRNGNKRQAYFNFAYGMFFPDKEDAMRFLKSRDWEVVDD